MEIPIPSSIAASVLQRLRSVTERRGAAGAQYLVVRGGQTCLEQCVGFANAALAQPVTPQTTFNVYSITKPFTAAAVVALAVEGRLDLDAPIGIAAGIDGLEDYGSVRETMLHQAGFRNPNPLRWIHPAEKHASFDEAQFVKTQVAALTGSYRGRIRRGYSNIGYLLLGLAIERASRGSYAQALQSLVFEPLRLNDSGHLGFLIERPELHSFGHLRRLGFFDLMLGVFIRRSTIVQSVDGGWVRLRLHHVNGSAYGGLMANARGLARFGQAIIGKSTSVLPRVSKQLLAIVLGPEPQRSLGWSIGSLGGYRWLAHAGGGLGYYGEFRVYPEADVVSCLLTNGCGFSDARCLDQIDAAWMGVRKST